MVMIKEINHLTLCAVSGKNINQRIFFNTNSACLAQAMATCKKITSYNFYLNTWRQIKFQRNCN